MAFDVDLFVIGGGSGGVRAARMAASTGARVALAESSRLGGTCVIRGCVPKKLMVFASQFREVGELAPGYGWQFDLHDGSKIQTCAPCQILFVRNRKAAVKVFRTLVRLAK